MLITGNVISPNSKVIKTTELELTFYVIKKFLYDNPMGLML